MDNQSSIELGKKFLVQGQSEKVFQITFLHPKLINKVERVSSTNCLSEQRTTIFNNSMLAMYQNYQFTYKKQVLPQMTPIETLLPQSKQTVPQYTIDIRLVAFDQRTARYHLKIVHQMIHNPILYQICSTYCQYHKQTVQMLRNQVVKLPSKILINQSIKISPNITDLLDGNFSNELLFPHFKIKKPQLVQFLSLSGFNPPPPQQKLDGNLFYLHLRTLEAIDYHITASPEGFFVNLSKISSFNPSPVPNKPIYASLFQLIRSLSQKFQNRLENFLAQNKLEQNDRFLFFAKIPSNYKWLQKVDHQHTWNSKKSMSYYVKELTASNFEDWNEGFHMADKTSFKNFTDFSVPKAMFSIYQNFEEAAVEGATMLIDGKISPLNPLQQKKKQIYIHNKIFFSIAHQTPYNHSQQKGEQAAPSSSAINTDLNNLEKLYNLKIDKLNVLHMVLINYRGFKIIAQCIIPGILSAQQNLCSQYGSIDDGKTIETNPEFEKIMIQVANKLHLEDRVKIKDGKGEQKIIAISPDIKGILGSNQKKYILDLLRLSPRDLNYPNIEDETCVLRSQLIQAFIKNKQQRKQQIPKINVNIGTDIKFIQNQQTPQQKALLEEMARYLVNQTIPAVINTLKNNGSAYLTNSEGISQAFHLHGLNMRYLGKLYQHPELNKHLQIKIFVQRVILTRCLKHLFRMAMRQTNIMYMNITLTRLLNCIFGQKIHIQMLEEGSIKQNSTEEDTNNKECKKKKKKIKNTKQLSNNQTESNVMNETQNLIKIPSPIYLNMKPSELWSIVKKLAKARYNFEIKGDLIECNQKGIFSLPYTKIATLQDLCFLIGFSLEQRSYNIIGQAKQFVALPFHYKNIVNICARSKRLKLVIPEEKEYCRVSQEAVDKYKFKEALDYYNILLNVYIQTNDVESLCEMSSKVGKILYLITEYQQAASKEVLALKIFQMGLRPMSYKVVQSYSKLGLYEMVGGNKSRALYFLHKSLLLMLVNYGQTYPDILVTFANIARIYQQDKEFNNSITCSVKALQLIESVTCKYHINVSICYSSLASLYYEMKDLKKAIQYQSQSVVILGQIFEQKDSRLSDAKKILKLYNDLILQNSVYTSQQVSNIKITAKSDKDKIRK